MDKIWICVGFLAVFGVLGLAESLIPADADYEYYSDEFDKFYPNSNEHNGDQDKTSRITHPDDIGFKIDENGDIIYDETYEVALKMLNNGTVKSLDDEPLDENNSMDDINDYQIEDNRSEVKDDKQDPDELLDNVGDIDSLRKETNMEVESAEVMENEALSHKDNDMPLDSRDYDDELLEQEAFEDVAENIADDNSESLAEEPKVIVDSNDDEEKNIAKTNEDTETLKNETEDTDDEFEDETLVETNDNQNSNSNDFIDETKRILEGTNEAFDEEENVDEDETEDSDNNAEENSDKSFENKSDTFADKDSNIDDESNEVYDEENNSAVVEDTKINTNVEENVTISFEHKSDATSEKADIDDDTVAQAYKDLVDDLNQLRETWMKLKDDVGDANLSKENLPGFDELDTKLADMAQEVEENDYVDIDDKDPSQLFEDLPEEEIDDDAMEEEEADEVEPDLPESEEEDSDLSQDKLDKSKLIKYVDDALIANEVPEISNNDIESSTTTTTTPHFVQEHIVEPLEDASDDLINIFSNDVPETKAADPVRITLSVDKPAVLTSPNYPNAYPPNTLIDYILEGKGRGIEFNVTDFALNSQNGDYVILKPGRVDPSGEDGIILSFGQATPRHFRFLDVDRMFIRFEAKQGPNPLQGYSFSVKLMNPLADETVSEPETMPIGYPDATITLNLGGVTLDGFIQIQEEFRQLVADMATMYIEANQIEPGRNTTLEVTQITSTALCFHNWPQFERCAEVRFGVPLQYGDEEMEMDPRLNEEDLRNMWFTYSNQNPFALRLQRLGITDFQIPNDNKILMVWLVIAAGVVISMAMLAFALWRFSCFENYTRMPAFSDTESVNEKKNLDLYPTPHQTLPPLYSDNEYKWGEAKYDNSTRVDMGGFANRSYVRTDDYDYDSEEEVVVPGRDRYTTDV